MVDVSKVGDSLSKQQKLDLHYLRMCFTTAISLSKDPSTKVGAVVVSQNGKQLSVGYNGFPVGILETPERWAGEEKNAYVIHAECNALLQCPFDTFGCSMYCNIPCCSSCMSMMLNKGISRIVTYKNNRPIKGRVDIHQEYLSRFDYVEYSNDAIIESLKVFL